MRAQTDVIEPEWEVLPPEEKDKRARLEPLFRWVAVVMDELIAFPNTKFKFGLDPLIGLVPGIGDTASAIVSAPSWPAPRSSDWRVPILPWPTSRYGHPV